MDDLDERLFQHLHSQSDTIVVPETSGSVDRAIARGRRRRHRARAVGAVATTLTLAAGIAVYQTSHGSTPTKVKVVANPDVAPTPSAQSSAQLVPSNLTWELHNPTSALGLGSAIAGGDKLIALSTAPGSAASPLGYVLNTLYTSTDGVDWSGVPLGQSRWISDLSAHGNRIYAVGTAAATAPIDPVQRVADLVVAVSDDDGKTWKDIVLPYDMRAEQAKGLRANVASAQIAAGAKGVVAAISLEKRGFLNALIPAGTDTSWGLATSPAGVSVLGAPPSGKLDAKKVCPSELPVLKPIRDTLSPGFPDGWEFACVSQSGKPEDGVQPIDPKTLGLPVARTFTWAELGTNLQDLAKFTIEQRLFYSADGTTFEEVSPIEQSGNALQQQLIVSADDDGFLALRIGPGGFQSYRSIDGRTWVAGQPVTTGAGWGQRPARLDDGRFVFVAAEGVASPSLLASTDGLAWDSTPLADVTAATIGPNRQGRVQFADVGNGGIALVVSSQTDPVAAAGGVTMSRDGVKITITDVNGAATVTDEASGKVLATTKSIWNGTEPALRTEGLPPPTGPAPPLGSTTSVFVAVSDGRAAPPIATISGAAPTVPVECSGKVSAYCAPAAGAVEGSPEIVVRDPDSGALRTRVAFSELQRLIYDRFSQPNASYFNDLRATLLTSVDGTNWSATDLSEVAGEQITQVAGVSHVGDQIVVRAQTRRVQQPEDPVVGTPTIFAQVVLTARPKR